MRTLTIDPIPNKVGKYDIVDLLGRGSMGVVYKGHDPYVDRPVAIKVATYAASGRQADNSAQHQFINEARAAGRLDHPNILKVYEAGEERGVPYMVMELVVGGDTLGNYCTRDSLLPISKVAALVRQSADALHYAHSSGVLHRDVKPANIMLTQSGTAKLGDFGIAKRMGMDQTHVGGWCGSPLYMSPEQALGAELTPQSDLFSLGVLFYEMLAGAPPFAADSLATSIRKVAYEDPEPLPAVREQVPEVLWRIVKKMLAKDLTVRYRTGAEIVRDLDAALEVLARSPMALSEEQRFEKMSALDFFSGFSKNELKEISKKAVWRCCAALEPIYSEGDHDRAFYVLAEGSVTVSIEGVPIGDLSAGECFGEMEYLSDAARTATVTARRECLVLKVDRDFREWASLPGQLRLNRAFQDVLVQRLQSTSKALARAIGGDQTGSTRKTSGGTRLRSWLARS